jgi:hypothetical protein
LASSTRGLYRATQDGDLLAVIAPGQGARLAASLGSNFYADPEMIDHAIRQRRAFNVIHIPMAQKIDIFPASSDFHIAEMGRAQTASVFPGDDAILLPVASAEDTVLAKLVWYREAGEVSEMQWRDIGGVLATNRNLDFDYLRSWAIRLRVLDLLEKALTEVEQER